MALTLQQNAGNRAVSRIVREAAAGGDLFVQTVRRDGSSGPGDLPRSGEGSAGSAADHRFINQNVTVRVNGQGEPIPERTYRDRAPGEGELDFRGQIVEERVGSRRRPHAYVVRWEAVRVPAALQQPLPGCLLVPGELSAPARAPRAPAAAALPTDFSATRAELLDALRANDDADSDYQPSDEDLSDRDSDVEMSSGEETEESEPTDPPREFLSAIDPLSMTEATAGGYAPLFIHSGSIDVANLPADTPYGYSAPELKRGDICTKDTFSALFSQTKAGLRVWLRSGQGTAPAEAVRLPFAQIAFRNLTFPKGDPAIGKLRESGIRTDRKAERMDQEGRGAQREYHAEELVSDSVALQHLADSMIAGASRLRETPEPARARVLEEIRTSVIVAINRTSCHHCALVLGRWLAEFWDRVTTECGAATVDLLRRERVFRFELASSSLYSETKSADLQQLLRQGWELTAYHQYDQNRMIGAWEQPQWDLVNAILEARNALGAGQSTAGGSPQAAQPDLPKRSHGRSMISEIQQQMREAVTSAVLSAPQGPAPLRRDLDAFNSRLQGLLNDAIGSLNGALADADPTLGERRPQQSGQDPALGAPVTKVLGEFSERYRKLMVDRRSLLRAGCGTAPEADATATPGYEGGNCLFEAVIDAAGLAGDTVHSLRALVADELRRNPFRYLNHLTWDGDPWQAVEDAATFLGEDGNWNQDAGDLAPFALANARQLQLVILSADGSVREIAGAGATTAFVYYVSENHYISGRRALASPISASVAGSDSEMQL
jgi:hypothetical protein